MKIRARTDQDKEIKRRRLVDAARVLFSQRGYQGASIGDITAEAGVSTGTFYLYFSSKTEIFRCLNIEGIGILEGLIVESIKSEDMSSVDSLRAIAAAYLLFFENYRDYYDIISILGLGQEDFLNDDASLESLQGRVKDLMGILKKIIMDGIKKNELNPVDPDKAAQVLWGLMDGILLLEQRFVPEITGVGPAELIEEGLAIILEGLKKN